MKILALLFMVSLCFVPVVMFVRPPRRKDKGDQSLYHTGADL